MEYEAMFITGFTITYLIERNQLNSLILYLRLYLFNMEFHKGVS